MGHKQEQFNIKVGTGIIKVFERIDIENYQIFSEFIDNSLQSFRDHKNAMIETLHIRKCLIKISWTNDEIIISDNAFGMDKEAFGRALQLNAPAKHYSKDSLSRYGIGLKYAAANLGDVYTIESTAYGSNFKYKGTVDIEDWKRNNPETMPVEIEDDFSSDKHFTTITIKNLKNKFNEGEMRKTIKNLGIIYSHFLDETKELEVYINDQKVTYVEPEIFKDQTDGSEVMETLTKTFIYEGKTYDFAGWIGVLNKGATQDAGLNLIQNNRVVQLRYRPKEIFGAGNDYKYQRIVGEIKFLGDNWEVRVNKDGIVWKGNGLQERFIEELGKMPEVKKIQKAAEDRRVRENPNRKVKVEAKNATFDGLKKEYQIGEKVCFTVRPSEGYQLKTVKADSRELVPDDGKNSFSFMIEAKMPNTISIKIVCTDQKVVSKSTIVSTSEHGCVTVNIPPNNQIPKTLTKKEKIEKTFQGLNKTKIPGESIKETPNLYPDGVKVKYLNTEYSFEIEELSDSKIKEWIDLKEISYPYENSYKLIINFNAGFFNNVYFTDEAKLSMINLCLSLALARITGVSAGLSLDKSRIMIDKLNDIIFKNGN